MSFGYLFRDILFPQMAILKEVNIRAGFHILDYGCGTGSYIAAAAEEPIGPYNWSVTGLKLC